MSDFKMFRETGDLSDLTIVVDGVQFNLHKFPLYSKSEYFRNAIRNDATSHVITLEECPGGSATFSDAADFCYGIKVDLSKENIVEVRCIAEFLEMKGEGNLISVCDKYLGDCLTSAKLSRSVDIITTLLTHCACVGDSADTSGVLDLCLRGLVDCWLKLTTKFSQFTAPSKTSVETGQTKRGDSDSQISEQKCTKDIVSLPLGWFSRLMSVCRDQGMVNEDLCQLVIGFIDNKLACNDGTRSVDGKVDHGGLDLVRDTKEENDHMSKVSETSTESIESKNQKPNSCDNDGGLDEVLDELFTVLEKRQSHADIHKYLTVDWIANVLEQLTANCQSRKLLFQIAADKIKAMASEELVKVPPSLMNTTVEQICQSGDTKTDSTKKELSCEFVDLYIKLLADRGDLTTEQFCKLSKSVPPNLRNNHDHLFDVVQTLLETDPKPTAEERDAMMSVIDFDRLSETALEAALSRATIPASDVAKAALSLCSKLRSDLNTAKKTTDKQETQRSASIQSNKIPEVTQVSEARREYDVKNRDILTSRCNDRDSFAPMTPRLSFRSFIDSNSNLRPSPYNVTSSEISPRSYRSDRRSLPRSDLRGRDVMTVSESIPRSDLRAISRYCDESFDSDDSQYRYYQSDQHYQYQPYSRSFRDVDSSLYRSSRIT